MKKLALITALLLATSPVAAQSPQQALSGGGTTNSSPLPNTGIICQPEHEWLWIEPRYGIEPRVRVERRVRIERRRWHQHVVHPSLPGVSAGQRTVQLNQRQN